MSKEDGPWRAGRRAWDRLTGWYGSDADPAAPDGRADPLAALNDVGMIRRLLDGAELEAVRSARQRGRSWAEIATRLGVTRQSAWERWRELDVGTTGRSLADRADVAEVLGAAARSARRRAWVTVPNLVGMPFAGARQRLAEVALVGISADRDDLPADMLEWADAVVTDQSPEAGARVQPGTPVTLWIRGGGDSGVREPRRPKPTQRTGRKVFDEPSEAG